MLNKIIYYSPMQNLSKSLLQASRPTQESLLIRDLQNDVYNMTVKIQVRPKSKI